MKSRCNYLVFIALSASSALAHTTVLPHGHPHSDEAGAVNSSYAIAGLAIIAAIIWFANRKLNGSSKTRR